MELGSPGVMRDWEGDAPTVMFQQDLARAHQNLISIFSSPIVDEAFMEGLDRELERIICRCSGGFETLSQETLLLVDKVAVRYLSKFDDLPREQSNILKGYACCYVGYRLDSCAAEIDYADFDD